ncbi:sugar phosphate isomerase/epimerase family protein [Paenibacillus piri]|uniref:Sugar phosphate isomerase/epimerase n=1 Tax=Paenibacillus piri TaxID=2547395 RepID=A0A4R5K954_9BACL|nr:sugar phosphate isomerase/epimerase family protein [Paenibacillus piri]TDF89189.1 sugar phosphate isomerase/epimerase [Paenibacillus piri]
MNRSIQIAAMSLIWNNPQGDEFPLWLEEVKEAGYDGVTGFAAHSFKPFIEQPAELKRMLDNSGLLLASIDVHEQPSLDYYKKVCEMLALNGCKNLVYIDPKGGPKEYRKLGEWLNRIGEMSLSYGIRTLYHNHTRGIGETFTDLERVHAEVDSSKVFKMLDLGHATKDFVDLPVRERAVHFLTKHWEQIRFMEFKDWNEETDLNTPLGEGYCDYDSVFRLIREKGYQGWILVEQNGNEGWSRGRSPLECSKISMEYVKKGLQF